MYYYVEFLRAKRCMRVVGIILGLTVIAAIGVRIWMAGMQTPERMAYRLEHSSTAHVTHRMLPDGVTNETIVDDPVQKKHAVIDRKGNEIRLTVSEPSSSSGAQTSDQISFGDESEHASGGTVRIEVTGDDHVNFDISGFFVGSIVMGLIAATMLAAPLAKENDGHLELTWTKPVSRGAYATAAFAVDIAAIVVSQIVTVVVLLLCALMFIVPHVQLTSWADIALAFAGPIAWYALLTGIGASIKRGPGMVIGMGWLGSIVVFAVAQGTAHLHNSIGVAVHTVSQGLAYLDPIAYLSFSNGDYVHNGVVMSVGTSAAVLFGLAVLYISSAVLQWRRLEA